MPGFNKERLQANIIALSESKNWLVAKLEWELDFIYRAPAAETCLCGHSPIIELCVLINTKNDAKTVVGNVCVKKFMDLCEPSKIFRSFNSIEKNVKKSLNIAAIKYAFKKGWLTEWEYGFLTNTKGKSFKRLSEKQQFKREQVNSIIVHQIKMAKRPLNL
uniref:Uncharacterized protein n=1 Tax=Panagrolaimus sp. ES5 TaxID=591445 RepID=A0AC34FQ89_9BILA